MLMRIGYCVVGVAVIATLGVPTPSAPLADDWSLAAVALNAGSRGDWLEARRLASTAQDPLLDKLVLWLQSTRPQASIASFSEITGFIIDNPDWPSQRLLRQKAEQAIDDNTSELAILSWFDRNEPLTLPGAKRYAGALVADGESERAAQVARTAWANVDAQTIDDEDDFYSSFAGVLTSADHARRVDRLLWAGRIAAAQRILPRVDAVTRSIAEARVALRQLQSNAPGLVAVVPADLQDDPGLVYDQVRWYRRKDNDAAARQVLLLHHVDSAQPDQFWQERSQLTRRALSDGNASEAYRVASEHGFAGGTEYAESEWLAGWVALRFLQRPDLAARHFFTMFENVRHPVSRARGAYWLARTATALGDTENALLWHKTASEHPVAFYGQLSAAEIHPGELLRLPVDPPSSAAEVARFQHHDLVQAIRILASAGEQDPERAFLLRLAELGDTGSWRDMTALLAHEIGRPDLAVAVARQSVRNGVPLVSNGYPLLTLSENGPGPYPVEAALLYAVVRQESAFDVHAVSPAGAQGLMQVMPGTARSVAAGLGIPYSPSDLINDAQYNVSIGSAYLGSLLGRYDNSYILALSAYNAGPARVSQWLNTNGDPRVGGEAAIDWIEMIPIGETRNYVQRCLENLQVYRARAGTLQLAQSGGEPFR